MKRAITAEMIAAPLPLIQLPPESRQANTGCNNRVAVLPVFRPIQQHTPVVPAPILQENFEETDEILEVSKRITVYQYPKSVKSDEIPLDTLEFSSCFERESNTYTSKLSLETLK